MWKYCKNIMDITFFFNYFPDFGNHNSFFFSSSHFRQLGCYNSYFLSPQFLTISATWLPQLVNLIQALPLEHFTGSAWAVKWILIIPLPKFIFSSYQSHHSTFFSLILFLTISATVLPKFSLSPHFTKKLWIVAITTINFVFYNI